MSAVHFEAVIYAVQILSFVLIAGPVMVRTDRRLTLALNPAWVASQEGFAERHGEVDLRPFRLATVALLSLLAAAAATSSRPLVFVVHTPVFVAVCLGFYAYHDRAEKRLRALIPEDPIRRAALRPRTLRAFVPEWVLWGLVLAAAAILGLNAWGYAATVIAPSRALANGTFASLVAVGLAALLRHTMRRATYRMSPETDSSARSLEVSLTVGVAVLIAIVCLYHSLGSIGRAPVFVYPPTQLHALIENTPWSWTTYFERPEYRWVELATASFIALIGPWMARSAFTRRLMAETPVKIRSAFEV
jgi:hypothetical protein